MIKVVKKFNLKNDPDAFDRMNYEMEDLDTLTQFTKTPTILQCGPFFFVFFHPRVHFTF